MNRYPRNANFPVEISKHVDAAIKLNQTAQQMRRVLKTVVSDGMFVSKDRVADSDVSLSLPKSCGSDSYAFVLVRPRFKWSKRSRTNV
jgi:hypothetical protein